jgi:hypothetical protein
LTEAGFAVSFTAKLEAECIPLKVEHAFAARNPRDFDINYSSRLKAHVLTNERHQGESRS